MVKYPFAILSFLVLFASAAMASGGADLTEISKTIVDISGLVLGLESVIGLALLAGAVMAYRYITKKLKITPMSEEEYIKLLEPILKEAVAFGVGRLSKADWLKIDTKNEAVANATNYVLDHGGNLLNQSGLTQEKLTQKLEAKLVEHGYDLHPGNWETPVTENKEA